MPRKLRCPVCSMRFINFCTSPAMKKNQLTNVLRRYIWCHHKSRCRRLSCYRPPNGVSRSSNASESGFAFEFGFYYALMHNARGTGQGDVATSRGIYPTF